ncbi:MAG: hypothetical protein ACI9GO_000905 [Bacteroidia bacterium]|jgi:uncharacterized protein (TIGR03032 family)
MDYKLTITEGFEQLLHTTESTLAITVYQAGKVLLINTNENAKINITPINYEKPMGVIAEGNNLAIATKKELHLYANSQKLANRMKVNGKDLDNLYFPRVTYHTGDLDLHDLAYQNGKIIAVNTRFSCVSSFDENFSFRPIWTPPFITENTPEDRCHLNGLEIENGELKYATALGTGNTKESWRDSIKTGGMLMDIPTNKILLDNLSMPHSPRLYNDRLFLLESAKGELVEIDRNTMEKRTVVKLNGLVRGLSIVNDLAFIGISKVREKSSTFSKLDDSVKAQYASIHIVDINHGAILGQLTFQGDIQEIYDIRLLDGVRNVGLFGLYDDRYSSAVISPQNQFWKRSNS